MNMDHIDCPRGTKPTACTPWVSKAAAPPTRGGFTLLELLVVLSVIALLASILLPGLSAARAQAKSVACRSNLQQIQRANTYYLQDSGGVYVPGAAKYRGNLHRWHGERDRVGEPFDSSRGPLVLYLGPDGAIRRCPTFPADEIAAQREGFELGNGGYGYNNAYIGVQTVAAGADRAIVTSDLAGAYASRVKHPGETVMFTDAALAERTLIEYSFAEPRYHPQYASRADPSIHFRHHRSANIAWCDGHVTGERRTFTWSSGFYQSDPDRLDIGWFGEADDNSFFDLQ